MGALLLLLLIGLGVGLYVLLYRRTSGFRSYAPLDDAESGTSQPNVRVVWYQGHFITQSRKVQLEEAQKMVARQRAQLSAFRASVSQQESAINSLVSRFSTDAHAVLFYAKLKSRALKAHANNVDGMLMVTVKHATLYSKSDAYVLIRSDGKEKRTTTVRASKATMWVETLSLLGTLRAFQASGLSLSVYEPKRLGRDSLIGGVHVQRQELALGVQGHQTINFERDLPSGGSVAFSVGWIASGASMGGGSSRPPVSGSLTGPAAPLDATHVETGTLRLMLRRGTGLKAADLNGKSDPYCIAQGGGQEAKSRAVMENLDPVWNEVLELRGVLSDFQSSGLQVHVYDYDRAAVIGLKRDDYLGSVSVPLPGLRGGAPVEYMERLSLQGSLLFSLGWTRDDQPDKLLLRKRSEREDPRANLGLPTVAPLMPLAPPLGPSAPMELVGTLRVHLKRAYGLKPADLNGSSDPYVLVECGGEQGRTKTVPHCLDPVWNAVVDLPNMGRTDLLAGLRVALWDYDRFNLNDALGELTVSLEALATSTQHDYAERLPSQGTLLFSVTWIPTPTIPTTPQSANSDRAAEAAGARPRVKSGVHALAQPGHSSSSSSRLAEGHGTLCVLLKRAIGVMAADLNGKSDPYVVATSGGQKRISKTIWATLDPVWNESLVFKGTLASFEASGLTLKLMDKDRFNFDDTLGTIHISLTDLPMGAPEDHVERLPTKGSLFFSIEWLPADS